MVCTAAMVGAQQQYNNTDGYTCNGQSKTCSTYALYRTFQAQESLQKVGGYFNQSAASVSNVSGLNLIAANAPLRQAQALYIPLNCSCQNVTSQMEVSHTIVSGDTFWLLSVTIYGGLTTYQAMEVLNPTMDVNDLHIGDVMKAGIFCACPTAAQLANGTNFLLTYTVYPGETLDIISGYFGIPTAELGAANELPMNASLGENTTLLVPLATLPPIATLNFATVPPPPSIPSPPASSPTSQPVVTKSSSSHTPLYIGVAVGAFGMTLAAVFLALFLLKACSKDPGVGKGGLYESGGYYHNALSGSTKEGQPLVKSDAYHLEVLAGMSDMVGSDKPILLSYQELQDATNDFSEENLIQGSMYRGLIGGQVVAIKQMKGNMSQELKILCQVHHSNLV